MSLDEALQRLLAQAAPLGRTEIVSSFEADRRVLAQDVMAALQVPPVDNSAMDGWAVRVADVPAAGTELPVSQRIAAGQVGAPLAPGSAARIFTGAPIPPGADAVVMQEDSDTLDGGERVRLRVVPPPGLAIRRAGEDIRRGAVVLRKGERLTPASIGLAASMGLDALTVAGAPRVALLSTGDELVMPGDLPPEALPPGAIYNSNRFFLQLLLRRLGCQVEDLGIVPDERGATEAALRSAAEDNDLILTSGGVSVGEEDHVRPAVQALGQLDLWKIAIKPGKPFACGHVRREQGGRAHFIGLPGNPVSSFVTFLLLVRPFVLALQGMASPAPVSIAARADFTWGKAEKRREFLRARRNAQGGLDLFENQGSGVLTSVHWADGLVELAPGQTVAPGQQVRFLSLAELMA